MTAAADDPEIEFSKFCGKVVWQNDVINILIYRLAGADEGWTLEVVNSEMTSVVWDETFAIEQEAYEAAQNTLNTEGASLFDEQPTHH